MTRDLIVTENVALDSVIDASSNWFVPSGSEDPDEIAETARVEERFRASADALLVGRRTFEEFRGYWPKQVEDPTGVARYLDRVDKYVVSSTLDEPGWDHTTILRGNLEDEVTTLKERPGGDIVVTGSISLVHALNQTDLVDEYRLFVYPVVVGSGRRLFDGPLKRRLDLLDTHAVSAGVVLLRYRTA